MTARLHSAALKVALTVAVQLSAAAACAAGFGEELLTNGGAESGNASGWVTTQMGAVNSAAAGTLGLPPGASTGGWVFTPLVPGSWSMTQTIDVSQLQASIDLGFARATFSALIQDAGFSNASVQLALLDAAGNRILVAAPLVDPQRGNGPPDWAYAERSWQLVSGTRALELAAGGSNQSSGQVLDRPYFDNLSLIVSTVPETSTLSLMLAGMGGLALLRVGRTR